MVTLCIDFEPADKSPLYIINRIQELLDICLKREDIECYEIYVAREGDSDFIVLEAKERKPEMSSYGKKEMEKE